jgi:predicted DNA-binding transcriptional regulator AlpA
MERIGLSRSGLYALTAQGKFPPSTRLSHKVAVWRESDVDAWIEAAAPARTAR